MNEKAIRGEDLELDAPDGNDDHPAVQAFLNRKEKPAMTIPEQAPEGWQLVPKDDPTRDHASTLLPIEMVFAGQEALENCQSDLNNYVSGETPDWDGGMIAVAVYRAMCAAAPRPAQPVAAKDSK